MGFYMQRRGGHSQQLWKQKPVTDTPSSAVEGVSSSGAEAVTNGISGLSIAENDGQSSVPSTGFGSFQLPNQSPTQGQKAIWKPKSYGTVSGQTSAEVGNLPADDTATAIKGNASEMTTAQKSRMDLSKLFRGNLLENFTVDNSTYSLAEVRATFYPKFENEKSDQEIRMRMIEVVSNGLAAVEVTLKHSGSLFMYAGHKGGAYAKNSFGNVYTAVGVFVLGRMLREAWGAQALKKQVEFNDFLEKNRMCISMELVTAVLGDHGQRPREDYGECFFLFFLLQITVQHATVAHHIEACSVGRVYSVVTAVTELGNGKPKFYSTPEIIAFCRKWRLPTNHVWLFSTRKSVTSFFAAYDALCEEGTATSVCRALDDVADISVPGSKDHIQVQGKILEGLVARIVSHECSQHMEEVLRDYPPPPVEGAGLDLGPSLREICAANRSDEKQQIKALLQSVGSSFCPDHSDWFGVEAGGTHSRNADRSVLTKFLHAHPADFSTTKLQLYFGSYGLKLKNFLEQSAGGFHIPLGQLNSGIPVDIAVLCLEMIRLMRDKRFPAAFKIYHNFHKIDSVSNDNLFYKMVIHVHSDSVFRRYQKEMRHRPGLWPLYRGFFVDINLFKANKERDAEIARNNNLEKTVSGNGGVSGTDGLANEDENLMIKLKFLTYKLRTFLIRNGLSTLFKDGPSAYKAYYLRAVYIRRKYRNKQLSSSVYLTEAEPFLEQYARRSPENQVLIGSAGNLVRVEEFLAVIEGGRDEEGDLETEREAPPSSPRRAKDEVQKDEGLIVFFPDRLDALEGIPGCAKSALCKELLNAPGGLGDNRPIHTLMGDLTKGKYWQKVADERRRKPYSVMLADKNAPNEEVWRQIEDMCRRTRASAVPVVPDSGGTESNPFSLDALAVFMFRVLQRVNHPGNLDKNSPNAGYVLLMFYHLYEGKSRKEFDGELVERFGSLIKMPLLKDDRSPLPDHVRSVLEEGISWYKLHTSKHGRLESTKGSYAQEWAKWEKQMRETLFGNADYLQSIQVPFESAVKQVLEQLKLIAKGEYKAPSTEKRNFGTIVFAAVSLPVTEIQSLLVELAGKDPTIDLFFKEDLERNLKKAHVTLAHKRSHGVTAVASYGPYVNRNVPVELTSLLFTDKMAAFEAHLGSVDDEKIVSKNQWPHVTIWTGEGVIPKEANMLPQLHSEGKATLIEINPPFTISGTLEFY
ncbi:tRNA ligase 1 [Citrus sinensis]|uniref:tRNA ligase 1 n=1 Tax=Citrus sinensis TaxID=2711 RepID=A0ACB8IWX2_CITSI|nr:tRNA ligase 1 [Citrus sinensis]